MPVSGGRSWFLRGVRNGVPIMLGYLAVSFALGITARNVGLTWFQAGLASLLNNASAGEYAGFKVIGERSGLWEAALMTLIANARYLLMSCAFSQKLSEDTPLSRRLLLGFTVTDEIFGCSMAVDGYLDPMYTYGLFVIATTGWTGGTILGVLVGNILPHRLISALSVGLFGMFLAVIIPKARQSRTVLVLVILSMGLSWACSVLPGISTLSSGMRVILLTVVLSAGAALIRPVKEDGDEP